MYACKAESLGTRLAVYNVLACTRVLTPPTYTYVQCIPGVLTRKMSGVTVSNGMAWNRDQSTMYYVDSDPRKVYTLSYSSEDGEISDQKVFRDYSEDEKKFGNPDGMTIDT